MFDAAFSVQQVILPFWVILITRSKTFLNVFTILSTEIETAYVFIAIGLGKFSFSVEYNIKSISHVRFDRFKLRTLKFFEAS